MFTHTMRLHPGSDLARERKNFLDVLDRSAIPPRERAFIAAQVDSVIAQYRGQLALNRGKKYAMRREFAGDGYRITMRIGENVLSKLLNFWR